MTTHRSFTPEFKAQVVLEVLTGVRSESLACQHYQLKPDLVSRWKAQFLEGAPTVLAREAQHDPALARVAELERLVGRLTDVSWRCQKKPPASWRRISQKAGSDVAVGRALLKRFFAFVMPSGSLVNCNGIVHPFVIAYRTNTAWKHIPGGGS